MDLKPAPESIARGSTSVERELVSSLSWLIRLRWLAVIGVLLGTRFATSVLSIPLPTLALYLLGTVILAYNALFYWVLHRLRSASHTSRLAFQRFARLQIGLDWLAMALLVYFTGGIESPLLVFFLFHIIISSMLLPHDRGFLYVALAPCLVAGIAIQEYRGVLPHPHVLEPSRYDNLTYVGAILIFFTVACYVTAYLSMTISRRLRRREDQLAALYRGAQATTSTLELPQVLDRLAEATAKALGCKAVAIRLLDSSGSRLEMMGSYGLSDAYKDKAAIEVARAPIDQDVLSGNTVLVSDTTHDDRLRYPDKFAAEGIHTLLCSPLIGKTGPIGVLRAYADASHRFTEDDADFLAAIAAQGAVAIENAQAYQLLEELDRSKSQFVRIVTHELRSPVQVAGSLLNVLDSGYVGELTEEQSDLVGRARRRIQFLQTLIDDLLDLAAARADVLASTERGLVSLTAVLDAVYSRFQAPAQEKGLDLLLEKPSEPIYVWGDESEIDRVLNNLVGNAVKYTPQGQVRLLLERSNDSARIEVSDTGIGIPADALPDLFREFFRARNAKEVEQAGTGLGLSIVKDLVERYGGSIDVESREGQGTTFVVTLPLAPSGQPSGSKRSARHQEQ